MAAGAWAWAGADCVFWKRLLTSNFFFGLPEGAGESVRVGVLAFATTGDAGVGSLLPADIDPKVLICLSSVTADGAAGDVDKTALLSSMDPNCTLALAGIGATTLLLTPTGSFNVVGDA